MAVRRDRSFELSLHPGRTGYLKRFIVALAVLCTFGTAALAQDDAAPGFMPAGFFDQVPPGKGPANVSADQLVFDAPRSTIIARGGVVMLYQGYELHADSLTFNQNTQEMLAVGNVLMIDPAGNRYVSDRMEVTAGMKEAILDSMRLTTTDGATITARQANYAAELRTILTEATYSPCGLCIDEKGRKIGWKVRSARMIFDKSNASITFEGPSLELLGVPVAWIPWLWLPDPSQPRAQGIRLPSVSSSAERGFGVTVPYFVPVGDDSDLLFSPMLMSRQGLLVAVDYTHRFTGLGEITVGGSAVYQLDPGAFGHVNVPPADWRGALQTTGRFTPTPEWTVGWSATAFTDHAYLPDYDLDDGDNTVNELYATYLTADMFADMRVQQFNRLGDYDASDDAQQGLNLPLGRFEDVIDLGSGAGRVNISSDFQGVVRGDDQAATSNGVTFVTGYEGTKTHLKVEAGWEDQWVLPAGIVATPYLGARLDITNYDGASSYAGPGMPAQPPTFLLAATPIAAMDFRWPVMAQSSAGDTHLFEPIAQLVYRGSSTTKVGITNDNAQSFIFDDTNLFSYNRFSGSDRQETGLRANIGGHYLASFANGGWVDVVAGQSFHLAGVNALGVTDHALVGTDTGLGSSASYFVLGAQGGLPIGINAGGKVQIDTAPWTVRRAAVGASFANSGYSASVDYGFIAANPALGTVDDAHTISGAVGVPLADYWTLNTGLSYDLAGAGWTQANVGATYNDKYLTYGVDLTVKPSAWSVGASFNIFGPSGESAF